MSITELQVGDSEGCTGLWEKHWFQRSEIAYLII